MTSTWMNNRVTDSVNQSKSCDATRTRIIVALAKIFFTQFYFDVPHRHHV
jgi:hypothetical protein